jgi:hypothetical protein
MKRVTLCPLIAFLTFSIGVACAFLWFLARDPAEGRSSPDLAAELLNFRAEPLDVSFCHLIVVPENYAGRVIRFQATYVMSTHGTMIMESSCSGFDTRVHVSVSPGTWEEVAQAMENTYGTRYEPDPLPRISARYASDPLDVVAVGVFERTPPLRGQAVDNPYRFELKRIERAVRPY